MKFLLLLYFLSGVFTNSKAQDLDQYTWVDIKMQQIQVVETYSTVNIANYVKANFSNDEDKLRAVYKWITTNIHYDKDSMYFTNWGGDPEIKMASILRKRKGVCDNYAALFTNIVNKCGIKSVIVSGYTKLGNVINRAGHSWCAVAVEKKWLLCDPTWDANFNIATNWFLITPENFIQTHIPFDPFWQLLPVPLTNAQIKKGHTFSGENDKKINVSDSVNAFLQLDTIQQLEVANRRIWQAGLIDEQQKTWYDYNKMKIAIVNQEQDMQYYNAGVKALNNAKRLFNGFVQYRNNNFMPVKQFKDLDLLFDSIDLYINNALSIIKNIGLVVENYQYNTEELTDNLKRLAVRVKQERLLLSTNNPPIKLQKK